MSDQDPSVRTWQDATEAHMAQATSAQARHLTVELDQLHRDYNAVVLERDQACALSVGLLRDTERLREVERENEVLRGDFTRVRGERDEAQAAFEDTNAEQIILDLRDRSAADARRAAAHLAQLTDLGKALAAALVANDRLTKQLADRDPIAQDHWIVARDGGRHCERCEGEVRRGEAYELQDGTGDLLLHIHCPTPEVSDE